MSWQAYPLRRTEGETRERACPPAGRSGSRGYRQQVEAATRFIRMEKEASQLRTALQQAKSKCRFFDFVDCSSTAFISDFARVFCRRQRRFGKASRRAGDVVG